MTPSLTTQKPKLVTLLLAHCHRTHPELEVGRPAGDELWYDGALRAYSVGGSSALNMEKPTTGEKLTMLLEM